ncbi:MAG: hypothetical protein CNCCGFBP_01762 [Fimbriimonadaceae bacterium]|nr:hypothetical protein [Fimbriimonadaceae bacterium]
MGPELGSDVDHVATVARIEGHPTSVSAADRLPLVEGASPWVVVARPLHRAVVLKPAIDVVGRLHVDGYRRELPHRYVIEVPPMLAIVARLIEPAVVADQYPLRVARVVPHVMKIDVRLGSFSRPRFSAVSRPKQRHPGGHYVVRVVGRNADFAPVVPSVIAEPILMRALPGPAEVVAPVNLVLHISKAKGVGIALSDLFVEIGHFEAARLHALDRVGDGEVLGHVLPEEPIQQIRIEFEEQLFVQLEEPADRQRARSNVLILKQLVRVGIEVVDEGVDDSALRRSGSEPDSPERALGKPVRDFLPRLSCVGASEDP